jgi:hypothetical protein
MWTPAFLELSGPVPSFITVDSVASAGKDAHAEWSFADYRKANG